MSAPVSAAYRFLRPARAFVLFAVLVLACASGLSAVAVAQSTPETIEVVGARRISAETIRHHVRGVPDAGDDAARDNAALKVLFATGQFSDVRIIRHGGSIVVTVAENPVVAHIAFEGRSAIEEKELAKAAGLAVRDTYTRARGEAALKSLREIYRKRGHDDVAIDLRTEPREGNRVGVIFAVREGAKVKIERIDFRGNRTFTARELGDVITTRVSGMFDFLVGDTPYEEARLDLDRELIVRHYQEHGFADVRVSAAKAERDVTTRGWHLTFEIDEGERYTTGPVAIVSEIAEISTGRLEGLARPDPGAPWSPQAVRKAVERMTETLAADGRGPAEVVPSIDRDAVSRTIGLTYRVRALQRRTIERIEVVGNLHTTDVVIRRELRFGEGDILDPLLVEKARRRLERLGLFKSVTLSTETGSAPDRVRLTVAVVEQASGEVGFGVGYSSSEGIIGDVTFSERNLLGRGQQLKLKLAGSEKRSEAELSFTEPYLLGRPLAAGFDLFYRDIDQIQASSFKSTRVGGDVRLGFDMTEQMRATVNYTLTRSTIYDVGAGASAAVKEAVSGKPGATSSSYLTSSVGYTLAYDTRNRMTNPMSGVYVATTQDLAGIGGDARHLRTTAEVRSYLPVTDKVVLASRVSGGTIAGWGGSDVRLLDMFYRGGETVRGFATGGIGPRDALSANRDALGGANYLATSAELRFPLPFMPEDIGLRGAVFADAGSLWGSTRTAKALPGIVGTSAALRASVGSGLIWESPVGQLRVDYASPLLKQPFDKTQALRFGLGPGF